MTMILYYAPHTRAARPRWLLEELEVPYELARVDLKAGEQHAPAYLALHPLGLVPVLRDGDATIFESGAICTYLADKHLDKGLAPPLDSPLRGPYLQWMFFAQTTLEPPLIEYHFQGKDDSARAAAARAQFARAAKVVADAVEGRSFLVGDRFSAADVMVGGALGWARGFGLLDDPILVEYGRAVGGRPAARRARAD
jgi:glutathione S-transferase